MITAVFFFLDSVYQPSFYLYTDFSTSTFTLSPLSAHRPRTLCLVRNHPICVLLSFLMIPCFCKNFEPKFMVCHRHLSAKACVTQLCTYLGNNRIATRKFSLRRQQRSWALNATLFHQSQRSSIFPLISWWKPMFELHRELFHKGNVLLFFCVQNRNLKTTLRSRCWMILTTTSSMAMGKQHVFFF